MSSDQLKEVITPYFAFIRKAFLEMLAYRMRYYTGIFTYTIFVTVNYSIWKAVYASHTSGASIKGFTLEEMTTYIAVGWIARSFYYSNLDESINDIVSKGSIANYLTRPVDFQAMLFAESIGESLFRLIFFSLPIGIIIYLLFPVMLPNSFFDGCMFILATFLGFFVFAALNFIVGLFSFALLSIRGVLRAKYFIVQLLSGLLIPLTFFPDWFRSIVSFLPFSAIAYMPLKLYLGKVSSHEVFLLISTQIAWIIGLVFIGRVLWKSMIKKLVIQGG